MIVALGITWSQPRLSGQGPQPQDFANSMVLSLGRHAEPKYPKEAIRRRIEGDVKAEVRIAGADGVLRVQRITITSGDPVFAYPVAKAVSEWAFTQQRYRERIDLILPITFIFTLKPKPSVSDSP